MPKGFSSLAVLILGIVVLSIIAGAVFLKAKSSDNKNPSASNILPTGVTGKPTVPSTQEVNKYPGAKEFSSKDLKIAFHYLPTVEGTEFIVKQVGITVYIGSSEMKAEDGQFVEVFEKPRGQSLEDAIKTKFLAGKTEKECWVVDMSANYKYPSNFKVAEITFPKPSGTDDPWWDLGTTCSEYAQSNGIRYFLEDRSHPDTFVFLNIGQYGIMAGENTAWQDTIRFLD